MIEVTCAVIRNDEGLVLAVKRRQGISNAGKWEFPGGKTQAGEEHEDCIIREINEELGISIIITGRLDEVEHDYGNRQIRLIPFLCETLAAKPLLRDHDEYRWVTPETLLQLDLSAADVPVAMQYAAENDTETRTEEEPEAEESAVITEAGEELAKMMNRICSLQEINMVARSAAEDQSLLAQLVTLSSDSVKRVAFMSSWALSKVSDINCKAPEPFITAMIDMLPGISNESVQRSFMRVIMRTNIKNIPESYHARLIDYCIAIIRDEDAPVAPKVYGMEILAAFCEEYPDMVSEVSGLVQIAINDAAGGMKAAGRKVLARLMKKGKE